MIRLHILLVFVLAYSCSSTIKPSPESTPPNHEPLLEVVSSATKMVGESNRSLDPHQLNVVSQDSIADFYYEIKVAQRKRIQNRVNLNLYFESDSLAQVNYQVLHKHFNDLYGTTSGNDQFSTWEVPSARDFVAKLMLTNQSEFYGKPVVEVKLIEHDHRVFRK